MKSRLIAAALAAALALSACATSTMAAAGRYEAAPGIAVTLGQNWSDITRVMANQPRNVRLLSIDGPFLNRLYVVGDLAPGKEMIRPESRETPTPIYRADMSDSELVEFVADSVAALGYQRPETANLRPAMLGQTQAVRFDLTAQSAEGLIISGTSLVARAGQNAQILLYLAPAEHYYARDLAEVEQVFASAAAR